jgi:hypothetical protein
MKLWITIRTLFGSINCDRIIPSYTLLPKHQHCLQQSKAYLLRHELWLTTTQPTCKRCITILRLHLPTYWAKPIFRIIQLYTHMIRGGSNPILNHSNSIYRIRYDDIFINCNWVVNRWQYTFTHKQYLEQHK